MCGSMVDIQSPTAEIRLGKKEERRRRKIETTGQKYNGLPYYIGRRSTIINVRHATLHIRQLLNFRRSNWSRPGGRRLSNHKPSYNTEQFTFLLLTSDSKYKDAAHVNEYRSRSSAVNQQVLDVYIRRRTRHLENTKCRRIKVHGFLADYTVDVIVVLVRSEIQFS